MKTTPAPPCDMIKRILFPLLMLLPLAAAAFPARQAMSKRQLSAIISEFRRYEGVEVVRVGGLGTALLRGIAQLSASEDPEIRQVLELARGIRRVSVIEYGDCTPEVRARLVRRLDRALAGSELLMEAKDGDAPVRLYGFVDERTDRLQDLVFHAPGDGTLVCLFGSLPLESLDRLSAAR